MADSYLVALRRPGVAAVLALTLGLVACGNAEPTDTGEDLATGSPTATQSPNAMPTTGDVPPEVVATASDPAVTGMAAGMCPLLDQREISAVIGHDVVFREGYGQATGVEGVCAYTSSDESVIVTVMAIPASFATEMIQELQDSATVLTGSNAEPIAVGDGGYAFGHDSGGEAATVASDLLFGVQIMNTSGPGDEIGNKMDAAVSLLERLLTTA